MDKPPVWIGVVISLGSSLLQSMGLNLQRRSHVVDAQNPYRLVSTGRCVSPMWHIGFHLYVWSNVIGSPIAMGFLPVVVFAPLGAATLVFNSIFATLLVGDTYSKRELLGTLLVIVGAVVIAIFGSVVEPNHSLEDLLRLFRRPTFIAYFSVLIAFIIIMLSIVFYYHPVISFIEPRKLWRRLSTGWSNSASQEGLVILSESEVYQGQSSFSLSSSESGNDSAHLLRHGTRDVPRREIWLGWLYCILAGTMASLCLLLGKSGTELVMVSIREHKNQFNDALSWVIVGLLAAAALSQLYFINRAVKVCNTIIVAPLFYGSYNLFALFNGLIYYDQWRFFEPYQILLMVLGVCILISGNYVMSTKVTHNLNSQGLVLKDEEVETLNEPGGLQVQDAAVNIEFRM